MTVCVGICSEEGVVLAADSKITYGRKHQTYRPKLMFIAKDNYRIGLASAGYKQVMDEWYREIEQGLGDLAEPTNREIRKSIKATLGLFSGLHPNEAECQEWLFVIGRPSAPPELYSAWKNSVAPEIDLAIIGCGNESVTDHLGSWITKRPKSNAEALRWAIFLIMQASIFVPGCGGPINALIFTPDGQIDERRPEETAQIQGELGKLHAEISDIFERVVIARPKPGEADLSLKAFGERVKQVISQNNP